MRAQSRAGERRLTGRSEARPEPKVVCVTVTYNRPQVLARCLQALRDQTLAPDAVVVVDNGDVRATSEMLEGAGIDLREPPEIVLIEMACNGGPGGGFNCGFAEAVERYSPTYLWVMDDDVVPDPEALAALMGSARAVGDAEEVLHWPTVSTPDEEANTNPGWSGFLIAASTVEKHGAPRADFVWWAEDTEYLQWRLEEKAGVRTIRVPDARVYHSTEARRGVPPCWKLYYEVRNATYLRLYLKRYNYWRLVRLYLYAARQVAVHPRRLRRAVMMLRGITDGVRGRLGLRVPLAADR